MPEPPLAANEPQRLRALGSCGRLWASSLVGFDGLARLASASLDMPVGLLSVIGRDRQSFLGRAGLEIDELPREQSICAHTILGSEPLVIGDLRRDPRVRGNPLVVDGPRLRAYAGHPVLLDGTHAVGVLCVMDRRPRRFGPRVGQVLADFAEQASQLLELRRAATRGEQQERASATLRRAFDERLLCTISDPAGRITEVNDGFCAASGYTREELIGRDHRMLSSGHHPMSFWTDLWRTVAAGSPWRGEICNRRRDGSLLWLDTTIVPQLGPDGRIERMVSLRLDITRQRDLVESLQESQRVARLGSWRCEMRTGAMNWSDQLFELFGLDPDSGPMSSHEMLGLYADGSADELGDATRRAMRYGESYSLVLRTRGAPGEMAFVRAEGRAHLDDTGAVSSLFGTVMDVTEQVDRERKIRSLDRQQRLFVEHTPAAVAMFDREVRYILASRGWYEQYGLEHESVIGRCHYDIFPTIPERWRNLHRRVLAGETIASDRDYLLLENGEEIWVRYMLCPWQDESGEIGGLIMFTQVITEQVLHEREIEAARDHAEAASRAKSAFLANISHEIRTPMTAILGYADLMHDGLAEAGGPLAEHIASIRDNAGHLLSLIDEVLDVASVEAGRLRVSLGETEPLRIVDEVVAMLRPKAVDKGLDLRVVRETTTPTAVRSDPSRLRRIFTNLIGNAIKFTHTGGVSVHVAHDPAARRLCFRIVDTGIGLSAEQLEQVRRFAPFTQIDEGLTRRYGGTGLGLSISNTLAVQLGGGITVESSPGQGSTFAVSIAAEPLVQGASDEHGDPGLASPPQSYPLKGVRILVVEDLPDNQRLIARFLGDAGAEIELADNGQVAIDSIRRHGDATVPHLVIMDMQMPVLDGDGATRQLRLEGYRLPIIAVTAHAMERDRVRCLEAGCDGYLAKPIDRATLIHACVRAIAGRGRHEAA